MPTVSSTIELADDKKAMRPLPGKTTIQKKDGGLATHIILTDDELQQVVDLASDGLRTSPIETKRQAQALRTHLDIVIPVLERRGHDAAVDELRQIIENVERGLQEGTWSE